MNIETIHPLIIPQAYVNGGAWDLPHYDFPNPNFKLTWVFFNEPGAMTYITRDEFDILNLSYVGWQQIAFENLRKSLSPGERFIANHYFDKNANQLVFVVFLNEDGIGSSRILLQEELNEVFPSGYKIALPDRSCGFAILAENASTDLENTQAVISKAYSLATTEMSDRIFEPDEFKLPNEWLIPIDRNLSKKLIEGILKQN